MKTQKTIKCSFCKKRKQIEDVYILDTEPKIMCICTKCNLVKDIV